MKKILGVCMAIFIVATGLHAYTVTASSHWELKRVADIYGVHVLGNLHDGFRLELTERQRLRGISLETVTVAPKPKNDPRVAMTKDVNYGDQSHLTPQQVIRYTPGITRGGASQRQQASKAGTNNANTVNLPGAARGT